MGTAHTCRNFLFSPPPPFGNRRSQGTEMCQGTGTQWAGRGPRLRRQVPDDSLRDLDGELTALIVHPSYVHTLPLPPLAMVGLQTRWGKLPWEVLLNILAHLDCPRDLARLQLVSSGCRCAAVHWIGGLQTCCVAASGACNPTRAGPSSTSCWCSCKPTGSLPTTCSSGAGSVSTTSTSPWTSALTTGRSCTCAWLEPATRDA